jgi:hypothetical protein
MLHLPFNQGAQHVCCYVNAVARRGQIGILYLDYQPSRFTFGIQHRGAAIAYVGALILNPPAGYRPGLR